MNKRIKDLYIQTRNEFGVLGEVLTPGAISDKFAEKIIRECAGVVKYYHTRNETVTPQQILQHFGVEE
jgi:hypothetical protein